MGGDLPSLDATGACGTTMPCVEQRLARASWAYLVAAAMPSDNMVCGAGVPMDTSNRLLGRC